MIQKEKIEALGLDVPFFANRFFTKDDVITFLVPIVDEFGYSIVCQEQEIEMELTEKQIEALKALNCYGTTGWTLT